MNEDLREDNTDDNCTTYSDPPDKKGRGHEWHWESAESNYRICSTCGRRHFNLRTKDDRQ